MKALAAGALRFLLLVLLAVAVGFAANRPVGAIGFHVPDRWWLDLKPWGDGSISYLLCALPYELPPEWEQGVENWDFKMSTLMEFDNIGCGWAQVTLTWEGGPGEDCGGDTPSCWVPLVYTDHGAWRCPSTTGAFTS